MTFSLRAFLLSAKDRLQQASGWKRIGLSFAFGSVMAMAMPPFNGFPLLWICLPALIFLLQGTKTKSQAFFTGWSFAFGFFVFGLYWIAASMFVDIKRFWWAVPVAVAGLPALFAIYYGLAAAFARKIGLHGLQGILAFGLLWFLADYARGYLFTGFPWNLHAYAFSGVLPILQITAVIGIFGLNLLTIVAACLPASLGSGSKSARILFAYSIVLFIALAAGGEYRLQTTAVRTVPDVRVRLVQPNISQANKWRMNERDNHFRKHIELSAVPGDKPVTHIFWPETASTYYLSEDAYRRKEIANSIPATAFVLTGVIQRTLDQEGKTRFYNSLVAVDGLGRLVAGYDKFHLVPFGEYMPFRKILPVSAIAASDADFSAGAGPRSLRVLGLPLFSPLICYEAIFPGEVIDQNDRPEFLLNVTNDGWYGTSTGPYQHFAIARARAIEEGLPLLRVANTGISGIIDPLGRVVERLGLNKEGVIDGEIPSSLPQTIYAKIHSQVPHVPVMVAFIIGFTIYAIGRAKKL